jgi:hypothetical protein
MDTFSIVAWTCVLETLVAGGGWVGGMVVLAGAASGKLFPGQLNFLWLT